MTTTSILAAPSRSTTRNSDTFGYNERGEVVFSRRDAENAEDAYAYDGIGNQTSHVANSLTNTYTHNALNQLVGRDVPIAPQTVRKFYRTVGHKNGADFPKGTFSDPPNGWPDLSNPDFPLW